MQLKTGLAFLGSLAGLGGATGLYFGMGFSWVALAVTAGLGIVLYIIAAVAAAPRDRVTAFGEFMRGLLDGLNAGLNGLIAFSIARLLFGLEVSLIISIALGLVNYLTVFGPISQSGFYQGLVGWLTWLMPMSWLIIAIGLAFTLFSLLLAGVTAFKVEYLAIKAVKLDWKTGSIFIKGGLVANLNFRDTAFNMGNFSFVDRDSSDWYLDHEAGHTLNLTGFGSIFHLVGALDENVIPARGTFALSERLAESNNSGSSSSNIPMWA